jgi:hypothetical protein
MDQNFKDMLDALNFIKEHMLTKDEGATKDDLKEFATKDDLKQFATKDDVRDIIRNEVPQIVREETEGIRAELTSIRRDLEAFTDTVDNIVGLPKEIDHALERIAAIERHVGINKKIAA